MEMFRVGGLSSEDLMRKDGNGKAPQAFLGSMFKMGDQVPAMEQAEIAPEEGDQATNDIWTADTLDKLKKERLVEVAAGVGVVDLTQTKAKLVEAILERQ